MPTRMSDTNYGEHRHAKQKPQEPVAAPAGKVDAPKAAPAVIPSAAKVAVEAETKRAQVATAEAKAATDAATKAATPTKAGPIPSPFDVLDTSTSSQDDNPEEDWTEDKGAKKPKKK